jgi:hypothetical protein
MCKPLILFVTLSFLVAVERPAAAQQESVKPASVETKKEPDTHVFVKTLPEGAKVLVDGEDVGSSPRLLVVPPGATKMTIEVELEGFPRRQRTVLVEGGRITRVTFDLGSRKSTAAKDADSGARPVVESFFRAMVNERYEDALGAAEGLEAEGLRQARQNLDLGEARIDRVFVAGSVACAVSTSFPNPRGDTRCALGFGLIRRGSKWKVRDVDFLPDYEKAHEFVDSFRRHFPLTAEESHGFRSRDATSLARGDDLRKIALRFGQALAEADEATLEDFWKLEDPLDRKAANVLLAGLRKAQWTSTGPSIRVDLVHHARIGDDGLSACYYVEPGMPPDGSPTPLFQYFELEDGRWRTQPIGNLRLMAGMQNLEPQQIQRRALVRTVIGLCFGPSNPEKLVAAARAQATALEALAAPPYAMPQFEGAAESIEKQLAQGEKLAARTWPELQEMAQWYPEAGDVGSPDDFYLAFYLEAPAAEYGREIPRAEGGEPFVAERLPCLTGEEIEKATLEESDSTPGPSVRVKLSDFGSEVLERVTRQHKGRKLAIVVEGKVVSAATIREVIGGGQAVITGSFTLAEAEELVRQLNSYRERCHEHLDQLRRQLIPGTLESGKSTGR